jgi:uncharacterized protein
MVQAGRVFEGRLPLRRLERLQDLLASAEGDLVYRVEFGVDDFDVAFVDIHVDTGLPLVCQRTMKAFVQPCSISQRLGLMRDEREENALPAGYEPLLVADGQLHIKDVLEDELILAMPLVALSPGAPLEQVPVTTESEPEAGQSPNPFAALGQLKNSRH